MPQDVISTAIDLHVQTERLGQAQTRFPESFAGQQEHFARTLPTLEGKVRDALLYLFDRDGRIALLGVLYDLHGHELDGEG
jgi:hypothetical protein